MPTWIKHTILAPIDNFQMDVPQITLNKNLSIIAIDHLSDNQRNVFYSDSYQETIHFVLKDESDEDNEQSIKDDSKVKIKERFMRIPYLKGSSTVFRRTLERSNYVMCWHFEGNIADPFRDNYNLFFVARYHFRSVVSSLRLMGPNPVGLFPEEHFLESDFDEPTRTLLSRTSHPDDKTYPLSEPSEVEPYIFNSQNAQTLKQLTLVIYGLELPRLSVALARLNSQYTRELVADRMIDAVIGLEALYINTGEGELSYRIALRVATHLGAGDSDKREKIFTLVRTAYDLRSKIVHGDFYTPKELDEYKELKKSNWANAQALLYDVTQLLREALKTMLLRIHETDFKTFHQKLDTAIRRGESFQS